MKRLLLLTWMGSLLAAPWGARGYVIATTEDGLHELHWETLEVPYTIHFRGAEDVHDVLLDGALFRAFHTWGEVPASAMQFDPVEQWVAPESEPQGDDVLYFSEAAWVHDPMVIALTSINYYPDTGEIVDVDIEFNGVEFDWTVFDADVIIDVQSIATHEIGHLVGLAHSPSPDSVMYFEYEPGELRQRTLTEDDAAGIAYLYPCEGGDCTEPFVADGNGCRADLAAAGRGGAAVTLALALALALWRRSRGTRGAALAVAAVWAVATGSPAPRADVISFEGLEPVLQRADGVVRGRVRSVEPYWNEERGHVHSTVTVEVSDWLRGAGPAVVELDRPSGALPGIATRVPGDPTFEPGQELILALAPRQDGRPGLVGMGLGRLEIVDHEGTPVVLRETAAGPEYYPLRPLLTRLSAE